MKQKLNSNSSAGAAADSNMQPIVIPSADIAVNPMLPAVLRLTLTKKWFDMIASGEKKEEYREIKKHWINRFVIKEYRKYSTQIDKKDLMAEYRNEPLFNAICNDFRFVEFKNGYGDKVPTMMVYCKGIEIGKAKPEWSDNWQGDVFVIKLGNVALHSR